jgi:hypothetical protein
MFGDFLKSLNFEDWNRLSESVLAQVVTCSKIALRDDATWHLSVSLIQADGVELRRNEDAGQILDGS